MPETLGTILMVIAVGIYVLLVLNSSPYLLKQRRIRNAPKERQKALLEREAQHAEFARKNQEKHEKIRQANDEKQTAASSHEVSTDRKLQSRVEHPSHEALTLTCRCGAAVTGAVRGTRAIDRAREFFLSLHPEGTDEHAITVVPFRTTEPMGMLTPRQVRAASTDLDIPVV